MGPINKGTSNLKDENQHHQSGPVQPVRGSLGPVWLAAHHASHSHRAGDPNHSGSLGDTSSCRCYGSNMLVHWNVKTQRKQIGGPKTYQWYRSRWHGMTARHFKGHAFAAEVMRFFTELRMLMRLGKGYSMFHVLGSPGIAIGVRLCHMFL